MEWIKCDLYVAAIRFCLIISIIGFSFKSCKPVDQELKVKVETGAVKEVGVSFSIVEGSLVDVGEGNIEQHGFCYSTTEDPSIFDNITRLGSRTTVGKFSDSLINLQSGAQYYVRAFAQASDETFYGDQVLFTTLSPISPIVIIESVGEVKHDTVEVISKVTDDGGSAVTARGVCWSLGEAPTVSDQHSDGGAGTGSYSTIITGLLSDTVYYIRAYATSSVTTSYSAQHQVSTPPGNVVITTVAISGITMTGAVSGGTITDNGGSDITSRGVCWSISQTPTTSDTKTMDGTGSGSFSSSLTSLSPGTTYFVRAYAINSTGTYYGDLLSFTTTDQSASLPILTTAAISSITDKSAVGGGNITDNGGSAVTTRGVCWGTSHDPDLSDGFTVDGAGTGSYASSMTGLSPNTTYYVRAYATNNEGTAYGSEVSFNTDQALYIPTVTTTLATSITSNSAISGGNITDDGGSEVLAKGVCWSTSANPDLTDSHTSDGNGIGVFASAIAGINPNTTYYIRAYATNDVGTSYGNQVSFTSSVDASLPTLITTAVTGITETSAESGGNITNDGGSAVIARGVCWSTSHNPDLGDSYTSDGNGAGNFASSMTGLNSNTTYYVRAYATNGEGTTYGNEVSFTTNQSLFLPTLTTASVTSITETSAVSGGNITDNGGSSIIARGVCWSTSPGPDLSDDYTSDGTGTGSYTSSLTGLASNTTYYVRAYATNGQGTGYGNEVSFNTNNSPSLPTIATSAVTNIATNSAKSGGNISNDGGTLVIARGVCWSISHNPDLTDSYTVDGSETGSFTSTMTGLSPNTTYYVRAYATNSTGTAYGTEVSFTSLAMGESVTDYDGNVYPAVVIGTQTWMAENLKTTHYANGDPIPHITDVLDWSTASAGAYCYYDNDVIKYKDTYGALYNWYAVDDNRNLCPSGWHVPTDSEWTVMEVFVGGTDVAGARLKEVGNDHWTGTNYATDEYGFTALPGGSRNSNGNYQSIRSYGNWWTSTNYQTGWSYIRGMSAYVYSTSDGGDQWKSGVSVRCIKD